MKIRYKMSSHITPFLPSLMIQNIVRVIYKAFGVRTADGKWSLKYTKNGPPYPLL